MGFFMDASQGQLDTISGWPERVIRGWARMSGFTYVVLGTILQIPAPLPKGASLMSADDTRVVDPLLAESEERYRAVIENASDMIQSVRPDGTFEFVNRAWEQKLGYREDELDGMTVWDIIYPDQMEHCQTFFMAAMRGETLEDVRTTFKTKDGLPIPVEGSVTSRFVDDKIVATHAFFRDITERLRAQELEERNARLEQEQHARYLEKMAALGKLSAGLSHELNNPAAAAQRASARLGESITQRDAAARELTVCGLQKPQWDALEESVNAAMGHTREAIGPLETSQREEVIEHWLDGQNIEGAWNLAPVLVSAGVSESDLARLADVFPVEQLPAALLWISESIAIRDGADIVARSTHRISELIGAVKSYSFMDRAAEQTVDIHDGIEDTIVILAHRLKNVTVKREYDRGLPPVRAFGSGLNQVWTNILDNAVDAVGESGTVTIRTRGEDNRVVVEIVDDGCGISQDDIRRVFEPFFTTKPQGSGSGLGLDIVWRIVTDEHNGSIEAESVPGNTVFRVSLPIAGSTEAHPG
jgi:PAS domain S-box-containing protein